MIRPFHFVTVLLLLLAFGLAACGGDDSEDQGQPQDNGSVAQAKGSPGDSAAGQEKFVSTCSACHGPEGKGVPGLGKDMTTSEFIAGKTDQELVEFIKVGRDPSDPLNTTGVAMPPKGGNPALSEEDLFDIVAYIRTIHE
jgi:disulfide bond formation protein DsbB